MWMNEGEVEQAAERFQSHPVLGKYARFLNAFKDEVNAHSDGWAYWKLPTQAADKLMTLLHGHMYAGMGAYPRLPEPTEAELAKTITPIKAFYTRRGYRAGMKLPELNPCPLCLKPVELHHTPAKVGNKTAHDYCVRQAELEAQGKVTKTVSVTLRELYNCRGVDGFDDLLEDKLGLFSDAAWKITGHSEETVTLEVTFTPETFDEESA